MLSRKSFFVLAGFQPIAREWFALQRELLPSQAPCGPHGVRTARFMIRTISYAKILRELIVRETCWFRVGSFSTFHKGFSDGPANFIHGVLSILAEIIPMATMSWGGVGADRIEHGNVEVCNWYSRERKV